MQLDGQFVLCPAAVECPGTIVFSKSLLKLIMNDKIHYYVLEV
jgi:hypothetical protein